MTEGNELPKNIQIGYACGMLGWSILMNIITVMLIYFYVPPNNSGMPLLVPQNLLLGVIPGLSLVVAFGRFLDAVTDPLIAVLSDRSKHPRGRRLPFMRVAVVPSVIFAILIFIPPLFHESTNNYWWLIFTQAGYYLALTIYIIPYTALLPELAQQASAKVRLSALLSLAFVLGMIISSQTPAFADWLQFSLNLSLRHQAFQLAIGVECLLGGIFMAIPLLILDERRHAMHAVPINIPVGMALRQTLGNRNFLIFIFADFTYFVCLAIVSGGLLYFLRVLLSLPESIGGQVMGTMVIVSLIFYPFVIRLADRIGKRRPLVFALFFFGLLLCSIFFFGKFPFPSRVQIFGFAILASLPMAILGILPYAIIAEIAERDGIHTGQQKEAMFFAARTFSTKLGQTLGIIVFTILLLFGKDPGDDMGIRLAGLFGGILCLIAGVIFTRFQEK